MSDASAQVRSSQLGVLNSKTTCTVQIYIYIDSEQASPPVTFALSLEAIGWLGQGVALVEETTDGNVPNK